MTETFLFNTGNEIIDTTDYSENECFYKVKNLDKFGNENPLIELSAPWEYMIVNTLDENEEVIYWSHKDYIIPYINPITNEIELFIPDYYFIHQNPVQKDSCTVFLYEVFKDENLIEEYITPTEDEYNEMTPEEQVYLASMIYRSKISEAKYNAIKQHCKDNAIEFFILDEEKAFGIKGNSYEKIN